MFGTKVGSSRTAWRRAAKTGLDRLKGGTLPKPLVGLEAIGKNKAAGDPWATGQVAEVAGE